MTERQPTSETLGTRGGFRGRAPRSVSASVELLAAERRPLQAREAFYSVGATRGPTKVPT